MYCRFPNNKEYFLNVTNSFDDSINDFIELDDYREDNLMNKKVNDNSSYLKKYLKDNKSFLSDKARWEIIDNEFAKESTEK
ncbi:MAG: hypothetical protein KIB43_12040 [Clostridium baratii]|uniref:Uncharacterized protein n=1 Tax=Clostridium baratii str. Sullivan TaxID=1415775 RepID=A0A0A7FZW7_9CLOT|nr:hypothetical protein [Clostridium baratii]AIY84351.1 hypothetical protein U729_366 [Clostridium baratii str. Sullivan]MBS6007677.1 hypothetical protein [Clostridium baratii]MDU1054469.1 hypothetical protein [Clostridium baratii]MDU4911553.1 hypothetical protein [Clostridium baratii]CUP59451.1 Uncharacterised protein [Clostridium baratii]